MKRLKLIMLAIYVAILLIIGVLRVPVTEYWGPEKTIDGQKYVALWKLQATDPHQTIDNYFPIYELNVVRVIYEILIISLIMYALYLIIYYLKKPS